MSNNSHIEFRANRANLEHKIQIAMYLWRKLNEKQREQVLEGRKIRRMPWHSPPHRDFEGTNTFIITAACYLHHSIIGKTIDRITEFEVAILKTCQEADSKLHSWTILPNHYHLLASTAEMALLRKLIGILHGRTARLWNLEDNTPGRKVWFNFFDRDMKSNRHYWASVNYIHNNAVHHGLVEKWQDWPYSSAHQFLEELGRDEVLRIWKEFPVLDYGKGWDVFPKEQAKAWTLNEEAS